MPDGEPVLYELEVVSLKPALLLEPPPVRRHLRWVDVPERRLQDFLDEAGHAAEKELVQAKAVERPALDRARNLREIILRGDVRRICQGHLVMREARRRTSLTAPRRDG